jgi:RNA polymerase sigma-70 factor, ECF subfamily
LDATGQNNPRAAAREGLTAAYDRYGPALYRYALMICAHPALAEDAVQQAFAKLAGLATRVAELDSLEAYLRVAVRREAYRLLAAPRLAAVDGAEMPALLEPVEAGLERAEQREALEAALRTLPAEQREIVLLKVYEGRTFQEIAEWLEIPLNTAASRYRYAMEKLRALLGTREESEKTA